MQLSPVRARPQGRKRELDLLRPLEDLRKAAVLRVPVERRVPVVVLRDRRRAAHVAGRHPGGPAPRRQAGAWWA